MGQHSMNVNEAREGTIESRRLVGFYRCTFIGKYPKKPFLVYNDSLVLYQNDAFESMYHTN